MHNSKYLRLNLQRIHGVLSVCKIYTRPEKLKRLNIGECELKEEVRKSSSTLVNVLPSHLSSRTTTNIKLHLELHEIHQYWN